MSRRVCVSAVKPRGQVLGSTLVQKSGRPAPPRGRRSVRRERQGADTRCSSRFTALSREFQPASKGSELFLVLNEVPTNVLIVSIL